MELLFLTILLVTMAGALASGYPVAFALPGSAILTILLAAVTGWLFTGDTDAFFANGGPDDWLSAGVTSFRFYWSPERDTLIAIPLFIFMGIMLQRSKIAEDLLVTMAQLFGPVPGGLGISVVFVGALLAATTGIVGATVVAMGLISLPAMLRHNYSKSLASGAISASGTLGQIIPPSIVLIILADQLSSATDQAGATRQEAYKAATGEISMPSDYGVVSTSAGDMFMGALAPGLVLVGLYMAYILITALLKPQSAPSVPYEGSYDVNFAKRVALSLTPPLALIFIVLGSIVGGVATVNQAGAIGAAGALIMAGYRLHEGKPGAYWPAILALGSLGALVLVLRNFDTGVMTMESGAEQLGVALAALCVIGLAVALGWSGLRALRTDNTLQGVMMETAKTSALVFIILLGAAMLTAAFRAFGGEELVRDFLTSLPGGFWTQFVIVMLVIFLLGFFLDFIEIAVVVVPIVAPILLADPSANVSAVWLGVMIGLNMQTSFLTPPFGFALFYLRGVAPPEVRTLEIYRGVVSFIGLQLLALLIVGLSPPLVNYLPQRVALTSETAPPPQNPRLQFCLEQFLEDEYAAQEGVIRRAAAEMRMADLTGLPRAIRRDLEEALDKAEAAPAAHAAIMTAERAAKDASGAFRPLHAQVRSIQGRVRKLEAEVKLLRTEARRADDAETRADFTAEADAMEAEAAALTARIPAEWPERDAAYRKLTDAELKARRDYRRTVDDAAEPVLDMIAVLREADAVAALREPLRALEPLLDAEDAKAAAAQFREARLLFRGLPEVSRIRSAIVRTRRELDRRRPRRDRARKAYEDAMEELESEIAWRQAAATSLLPALERYEAAIRETVGVRRLERLPRRHALAIASCQANHRDISLSF
ncbi:MAG: TRAP transporter large permease subunit [Pseudomonadota bacterium]